MRKVRYKVKYPVKSEAIREIQEEIAKTRASWKEVDMLKSVYIDIKYYELIKGVRIGRKSYD